MPLSTSLGSGWDSTRTIPIARRIHLRFLSIRKVLRNVPYYRLLLPIVCFFLCMLIAPSVWISRPLSQPTVEFDFGHTSQILTPRESISVAMGYTFNDKQNDVRHVTRATYRAYFNCCRGRDEFNPVAGGCHDWFNVGLTTLDSLDTLLLMRLDEEYRMSREWAASNLSFDGMDDSVSGFELIIRALAGLLSAHTLTGDALWKRKAAELADLLLPSFNVTRTGCIPRGIYVGRPFNSEDLLKHESVTSPADTGSMQLEMRTASQIIGDKRYGQAADRCLQVMVQHLPHGRVVPTAFDTQSGRFLGTRQTIGGSVDSFYEMLLKTWIASGKRPEDLYLQTTFKTAIEVIFAQLHAVSASGLAYIGERRGRGKLAQTMDHLVCFFPGVLALGALHGLGGGRHGSKKTDYLPRARALMRSCYEMTRGTAHGLAGEITSFNYAQPRPLVGQDSSYLRPEIVESLFYLDLIDPVKDGKYKRWGWDIWTRMRKSAQAPGKPDGVWCSWTNILASKKTNILGARGKLHSFVIAETFKYFFLLFDSRDMKDAPFAPDKWVFNTEAHPFRIVDT